MLTFLPGPIRGGLSLVLITLNTIFWMVPLLLFHFLKLAFPLKGWRGFWGGLQNGIGTLWISFNNGTLGLTNPVRWDVEGVAGLDRNQWYLVIANHRTWVDVLVLQKTFNGKIPFLKFFLKKELFWVPFLGLAWWALDYPFLARSALASKDLEAIQKAAEKFKILPVSVMNFVEGTRFTPEKHEKQRAPYDHLLKPKPGGMTFLLSSMRDEVRSVLDVTIAYPGGTPTMWEFFCGQAKEIRVRVKEIPVTEELVGDFGKDKAFRRHFTTWLKQFWEEKDRELGGLLGQSKEA
jgi:1-acyl-sn-glycerol-3-phosphate acyltransferase